VLEIESPRTLQSFCAVGEGEAGPIFADASGTPMRLVHVNHEQPLDVLIGPEGGWTDDELSRAKSLLWRIARAGPHVMRIETAAAITTSIILSAFDA
jgi:RsmE family RNA methyltransferase